MSFEHKRGASFDYFVDIPEDYANGYFVGWTATSQVRTARYDKLLSNLTCTWEDPVTTRRLFIRDLFTSDWDLGECQIDVLFVRNSDQFSFPTNTETFTVVKDITRPQGVDPASVI